MPLDPEISLKAQTPNFVNTIGSLANTANALQAFQLGNIALQSQRQANTERQNVIKLIQSDPAFKPGDDGVIPMTPENIAKMQGAAPQTYNEHLQKIAQTNNNMTIARQSLLGLGKDNAGLVAQAVAATQGMPMADRAAALSEIQKNFPGTKPFVDMITHHLGQINGLPAPDAVKQGAISNVDQFYSRFMSGVQQQQQMNTPEGETVSTGAMRYSINKKPGVAGLPVGAVIPGTAANLQVSPEARNTVQFDQNGNPILVQRSVNPNEKPVVSGAPVVGGAGTTVTPPRVMPPGESKDTVAAALQTRLASNAAASRAYESHFNNQQIVKLADETNTGKGAEIVAGLKGQYAGIPWSSNDADNFNRLGHFIALENVKSAQTAGIGGTDAANRMAIQASVDQNWTRDTVKSAAKINDALRTGEEMFNSGMEAAIKKREAAGQSYPELAARQFQQDWSKVANIDAMRLYNAKKNGDNEELSKIQKQYGGVKSPQYLQLMHQIKLMGNMIKTGGM